jgi:hypothetical protein
MLLSLANFRIVELSHSFYSANSLDTKIKHKRKGQAHQSIILRQLGHLFLKDPPLSFPSSRKVQLYREYKYEKSEY